MATYDQIATANQTIQTTNIKGKAYAEVNQRIKAFRMVYPHGAIITEIVNITDGTVTMTATVYDEDGSALAVGHAQEKENSSYINKTSFIENCETSAVGRALGLAGFGIDTAVASADEVRNATRAGHPTPDTPTQRYETLDDLPAERQAKVCTYYDVATIDELTPEQAAQALALINRD